MTVKLLVQNINSAIADGKVTNAEMQTILSQKDPLFGPTVSLGDTIDSDEIAVLQQLRRALQGGNLSSLREMKGVAVKTGGIETKSDALEALSKKIGRAVQDKPVGRLLVDLAVGGGSGSVGGWITGAVLGCIFYGTADAVEIFASVMLGGAMGLGIGVVAGVALGALYYLFND